MRPTCGIDASSRDLRIHGTQAAPIRIVAGLAGTLPLGAYTGNSDDEIVLATGAGNGVVTSQTYRALGVPYHVGDGTAVARLDVTAPSGVATLTIDAGVTMRFEPGGGLRPHRGAPLLFVEAELRQLFKPRRPLRP